MAVTNVAVPAGSVTPTPPPRKVVIMKKFFAAFAAIVALAIPITAIAVAGDPGPRSPWWLR